jgi:hypothetical protein
MPSTPHNDLHPTARNHAQKESCEESQCDWRVNHCHSPCEAPVFRSRPRSGDVLHRFPDVILVIWHAAIYWTPVVPDIVMVGQP